MNPYVSWSVKVHLAPAAPFCRTCPFLAHGVMKFWCSTACTALRECHEP